MKNLKRKLNYYYRYFDISKISPDPLEFVHKYSRYNDIEIAGIISSIFAYGNVTQIITTLERLHLIMEEQPYEFVRNFNYEKDKFLFQGLKHRFYTWQDIAILFYVLKKVYENYVSIRYLFMLYYFNTEEHLKHTVSFFSKNMLELSADKTGITNGLKFMFPDPLKGSACKRLNLFLRWMVRKDSLDLGLWEEIPKNKLVIPVDTHIARIARELNLTKRNNVSWLMAEEITDNLRKFNEEDPVKYDFSLCHIGIRKMKF